MERILILVIAGLVTAVFLGAVVIAQSTEGDGAENGDTGSGDEDSVQAANVTSDQRHAHGLCVAWNANEQGRLMGNASEAPSFVWLQEQANGNGTSVDEYCSTVEHPGRGAIHSESRSRGPPHDVPRGPPPEQTGNAIPHNEGPPEDGGQNYGQGRGAPPEHAAIEGAGKGLGSGQGPGNNQGSGRDQGDQQESQEREGVEDEEGGGWI